MKSERKALTTGRRLGLRSQGRVVRRDFTPAIARFPDTGGGDRQLGAARAGAAGVEEEDAIARFDQGLVGMPEHHGREARGRWVELEL